MNSPGQLVSHMSRETFNLRHGFLSSYEVAIFARRLDDYRIELSPPIHRNAQHPSPRECFCGFSGNVQPRYQFLSFRWLQSPNCRVLLSLACGKVTCSSVWPAGYILILSHVQGKPLLDFLLQLHVAEVDHVKCRCRSVVEILRDIGIWIGDCGVHNVLYNRQSCKVTLLDFEVIGDCDVNHKRYLEDP